MNRLYNQFDAHKWSVFSGADYLSDNEDFTMIFSNDYDSPKVNSCCSEAKSQIWLITA